MVWEDDDVHVDEATSRMDGMRQWMTLRAIRIEVAGTVGPCGRLVDRVVP